jgi:hypothetical protein
MDPNTCLKSFVDAYESGQLEDAAEHHNNLTVWLNNGGFEPDWNLDPSMWYQASFPYLVKPLDI